MIAAILLTGCASVRKPEAVVVVERPEVTSDDARTTTVTSDGDEAQENDRLYDSLESKPIQLTGFQSSSEGDLKADEPAAPTEPLQSAAPGKALDAEPHAVQFDAAIKSVYRSYPMLESALLGRNVAWGQQVGASGAFDLKLKGASENGPQGFYQTYRQSIGVIQPTYWGGEVFAGYRVGRGDFQPWYQERQTNDAGEFKAGVQIPLARNRDIDARRAELWKAGYGRSLAEPDIQAQLIGFVQDAFYAYWDWVAAGENHRIAKRILALAEERTARIEEQVKAGFVDPPELTDNLRLVAIRQAKVADTRRKIEQTAAKLSVYRRDAQGNSIVATEDQLPGFPETVVVEDDLGSDIQLALSQRPELRMLDLMRQQVQVDYSEATNQLQPELNAVLWGSQDIGEPTSSKRDKSPFESEASVYLDVPIQRRKALGKMTETQSKIAQLSASGVLRRTRSVSMFKWLMLRCDLQKNRLIVPVRQWDMPKILPCVNAKIRKQAPRIC